MSEAPAKFPGVFPKSDPHAAPVQEHHSTIASSIENPYALNDALTRLDVALEDIIALFQQEHALEMFKSWQQKIEDIRTRKE
ncbi:unnamed protein product [Tilletia caries]|nr:unnamed protein product [Tilletia caries]